jgi:hypothetical protein
MPDGKDEKQGGNKWAVMGGIALNVEYARKYGFEASAAARVTARLVAVPPPAAFQAAVQADAAGRAKRAAALPPQELPQQLPPPSEKTGAGEWEDGDSFAVEETLAGENAVLFDTGDFEDEDFEDVEDVDETEDEG